MSHTIFLEKPLIFLQTQIWEILLLLPGLEPGWINYPQAPQACVSTYSTITAFFTGPRFEGKKGLFFKTKKAKKRSTFKQK